jgi:hypothetical protein
VIAMCGFVLPAVVIRIPLPAKELYCNLLHLISMQFNLLAANSFRFVRQYKKPLRMARAGWRQMAIDNRTVIERTWKETDGA